MTDRQFGRLVGQTIGELDELIDRFKQQRKIIVEIAENRSASTDDKMFDLHAQMMILTLNAKRAKQNINKRWNAITELIGWDIRDDWKDI